jgi:hypothetical protein
MIRAHEGLHVNHLHHHSMLWATAPHQQQVSHQHATWVCPQGLPRYSPAESPAGTTAAAAGAVRIEEERRQQQQQQQIIRALCAAGAHVEARNAVRLTPLAMAVSIGQEAAVKTLLGEGTLLREYLGATLYLVAVTRGLSHAPCRQCFSCVGVCGSLPAKSSAKLAVPRAHHANSCFMVCHI